MLFKPSSRRRRFSGASGRWHIYRKPQYDVIHYSIYNCICRASSHTRKATTPLCPDLSAVREGDLSDRLHQQDDRGTGVASVQGSALVDRVELSGNVVAMYERVLCETVNW